MNLHLGAEVQVTKDFNARVRKLMNRDSPLVGRRGIITSIPSDSFPYTIAVFDGLPDTFVVSDDMLEPWCAS